LAGTNLGRDNYVRPKQQPYQAVEMARDVKDLRSMFMHDDPRYDDKLEGLAAKYGMDDRDIRRLQKRFSSPKEEAFDPSIFMFSKLPWEAQKPLLDRMTDKEREKYLLAISKQKRSKYERETAS
jgi:hypothetical protein